MAENKRAHLVETALELFNEFGFHATGIDRVQAESGMSKTTMYKYFPSKEDLIQAALALRHAQFKTRITERTAGFAQHYSGRPEAALLAIFDALDEWLQSERFFGCNFINATAEYSDPAHPVHQLCQQHKQTVQNFAETQIPPLTNDDQRDELAREICLLIDGAIVSAQAAGHKDAARRAKRMLERLLEFYGLGRAG